MSLRISVEVRDAVTGTHKSIELKPGKDLGGFEDSRKTMWGADVMREIGLTLIPTLYDSDIFAEGEELDHLEREARAILRNMARIVQETGWGSDFIEGRVQNILDAIQTARDLDGRFYMG